MTNKTHTHFSFSFQLCLKNKKAKMGIIQQYDNMKASSLELIGFGFNQS
jgi:hypothetical protein